MRQPPRLSGPDAGPRPGSPADDGIDLHVDEPAAGRVMGRARPLADRPRAPHREPDEPDPEPMFRLGDLEGECPEKSHREQGARAGLRLPPRDDPRDFDPAPPCFLLACYLIIVLIVLAGLILISA